MYVKDLIHFYPVDPFFRKTIIVDRQYHTSIMDISNLCPIVPFYGDHQDTELEDLTRLIRSLSRSDNVKVDLATLFDIVKALKCESIDSVIKFIF